MKELELTYLAKYIPDGLSECSSKRIVDRYIPFKSAHPVIRLRKSGEKMELTKKEPISGKDSSFQLEQTIIITQEEYAMFEKISAKVVAKTRYNYPYQGRMVEVDVFEENLVGLVLVDVEFESHQEKENFLMPEFCLAEVTQEKFTAGGMLAGKKFSDIQAELVTFGYAGLEQMKKPSIQA
jgi:CYTH domain-containing protein